MQDHIPFHEIGKKLATSWGRLFDLDNELSYPEERDNKISDILNLSSDERQAKYLLALIANRVQSQYMTEEQFLNIKSYQDYAMQASKTAIQAMEKDHGKMPTLVKKFTTERRRAMIGQQTQEAKDGTFRIIDGKAYSLQWDVVRDVTYKFLPFNSVDRMGKKTKEAYNEWIRRKNIKVNP